MTVFIIPFIFNHFKIEGEKSKGAGQIRAGDQGEK
jgi:hypothetical protein